MPARSSLRVTAKRVLSALQRGGFRHLRGEPVRGHTPSRCNWTRIGVAYESQDGSFNLRFDYLPADLNGTTVQLRDFVQREVGSSPTGDAGSPAEDEDVTVPYCSAASSKNTSARNMRAWCAHLRGST